MATVTQTELKKMLQVQLPDEIVTEIKIAAIREGVAPGVIITELVRKHLLKQQKTNSNNKAA